MLWNPTRDTSQRRAPRGGAVLAAACLAWLGFRGRARLLPSVVLSRSDERPRLGPAVRVKGLQRTASKFSALFGGQPVNFPNMSHHRLVYKLRLIVQALREPVLLSQTLRLISNRPQSAAPVRATFKEKKSPVAFSQGCCLGIRKTQIRPHPGNAVWSLFYIYTELRLCSGPGASKSCFPLGVESLITVSAKPTSI